MEKELVLAIDFKKSPKEVQDAANAHYGNVKSLRRLEKRNADLQLEIQKAKQAFDESAKALRLALKNWEPEV